MNKEHIIDPSQIARRDLFMLAMVSPLPLANSMRRRHLPISVAEEFLSEVTASVTTCWYLLQSDGLTIVELVVPQYLPWLVELVRQYPPYRQRAVYLSAQSFLLRGLVAHHRLCFAERVTHCQEAVTHARESGDRRLLVACLTHLADAFRNIGQQDEMLKAYLKAEHYSNELLRFLRSKVLAESGLGHAQVGKSQEAISSLGEARALFAEGEDEIPVFLLTDHDLDRIILHEGWSSLELGNHAKKQDNLGLAQKYWKDAAERLGQIEQLPSGIIISARIAAEVEIARALTYALEGNMEGFLTAFEKGVRQAKALGSEKRKQEAREALKVAIERWSKDQRVTGLWELLI